MESRALIAFVLSIGILVGYQYLLARRAPAPVAQAPAVEAPPTAEPSAAPPPPGSGTVAPKSPQPAAYSEPELTERVETDRFEIVASSRGGRLKSYRLKAYRENVDPGSPAHELIPPGPVQPLGLYWTRPDGTIASDQGVTYSLSIDAGADGGFTLSMAGVGPAGEKLSKRLSGTNGSYALAYEAEVVAGHQPVIGVAWARSIHESSDRFGLMEGPAVFVDGALEAVAASALDEPATFKGSVDWAGYADHYFVAAYYPDSAAALRFSAVAGNGVAEATLWAQEASERVDYQLYAGPKKLAELRLVGHRLEESVDLGWFAFIARPLLELMLLLNKLTGNYGWSIILLTVGVRLLFYPINKRQALAMKAMQKVQPELKRIQEKYKDDRERLNRELMEVYRRHKVNPLAGCLPMLLQLPVFLGLYNAFMQSIELRHAPFMGWITDLSQPDRLGSLAIPFVNPPGIPVLTLFMGASMLVQQKMMPAAGDPTQQKMMMLMPVIFTVMFINFPSGLVLYWFASNVMSIAQQYLTNRASN